MPKLLTEPEIEYTGIEAIHLDLRSKACHRGTNRGGQQQQCKQGYQQEMEATRTGLTGKAINLIAGMGHYLLVEVLKVGVLVTSAVLVRTSCLLLLWALPTTWRMDLYRVVRNGKRREQLLVYEKK